jgi:hypothetical protein
MPDKKHASTNTFTKEEVKFLKQFKKPYDIQIFLNNVFYNAESGTHSPRYVIQKQKAHCFEGALFAAAALQTMGHKPLIVDMMAHNDDDHVIAVFKQNNLYGAVAKSNTTLLRFREPVFRTIRELALSYFEYYFNTIGHKSLRSYSNLVNLSRFEKDHWMTTDDNLDFIGDYLYTVKHHNIVYGKMVRSLSMADEDIMNICFSGSLDEGLYKPVHPKKKKDKKK